MAECTGHVNFIDKIRENKSYNNQFFTDSNNVDNVPGKLIWGYFFGGWFPGEWHNILISHADSKKLKFCKF